MKYDHSKSYWLLLAGCVLMLLPFIGLAEFYSKGEPREAVVAVSMLKDGNWILPVNNGGDIPYKPPFLHWCIALVSLLPGYVSEFTSRLPSALSLIAMVMGGYSFFRKRKSTAVALLASLLTLTAFEVHRAGMACRVDMMLTAFIVGALYLFYRWWEQGMHGFPFLAVVAMTGAVLTKGPVGMVLPCLVMGTFLLLRGEPFVKTLLRFIAYGAAALLVPACWYAAAYQQGGDAFWALVMEENFGRFMGKMSYESHVHPFTYNFVTLLAGWLPYTLVLAASLFVLPWRTYFARLKAAGKRPAVLQRLHRLKASCRHMQPLELFVWLSFVLILVFYCIPSSKRSTYLLPCYPFMAYLIARYLLWLSCRHAAVLRLFAQFIGALGVVLGFAFVVVRMQLVPHSVFHGKHAANNILMLRALENSSLNFAEVLLAAAPFVMGIAVMVFVGVNGQTCRGKCLITAFFAPVFTLLMSLDGVFLPKLLSAQSDRDLAQYLRRSHPAVPLYSYISTPMMHFFCTNFYAGDRIMQFERELPASGLLIISQGDAQPFFERHKDYRFELQGRTKRKRAEVRDYICFYRIVKRNPSNTALK